MATAVQALKRAAYLGSHVLRLGWWHLRGGRSVDLFGVRVKVHPRTDFPKHRRFPLPAGPADERIVQYTDFVQLMSLARCIDAMDGPVTIVEVGAHDGAYAVILGRLVAAHGGRVIAVEPNSKSFARLRSNVSMNGLDHIVTCVHAAAGDRRGAARIAIAGSQSGISGKAPWQESCAVEDVDVLPLSSLLDEQRITKVDILVVDVEGAELQVLRGIPWNTVWPAKVYCEFHPYAWPSFGYSKHEMFEFLRQRRLRAMDMYLREIGPELGDGYVGPTLLIPDLPT